LNKLIQFMTLSKVLNIKILARGEHEIKGSLGNTPRKTTFKSASRGSRTVHYPARYS